MKASNKAIERFSTRKSFFQCTGNKTAGSIVAQFRVFLQKRDGDIANLPGSNFFWEAGAKSVDFVSGAEGVCNTNDIAHAVAGREERVTRLAAAFMQHVSTYKITGTNRRCQKDKCDSESNQSSPSQCDSYFIAAKALSGVEDDE